MNHVFEVLPYHFNYHSDFLKRNLGHVSMICFDENGLLSLCLQTRKDIKEKGVFDDLILSKL